MQVGEAPSMLGRTPAVLTALLPGQPSAWPHRAGGPDGWSVYHIVGHLCHGAATGWPPRRRIILRYGPDRPFQRLDPTHLRQVDEVMTGRHRDEVGPWRAYLPALERTAPAE